MHILIPPRTPTLDHSNLPISRERPSGWFPGHCPLKIPQHKRTTILTADTYKAYCVSHWLIFNQIIPCNSHNTPKVDSYVLSISHSRKQEGKNIGLWSQKALRSTLSSTHLSDLGILTTVIVSILIHKNGMNNTKLLKAL